MDPQESRLWRYEPPVSPCVCLLSVDTNHGDNKASDIITGQHIIDQAGPEPCKKMPVD